MEEGATGMNFYHPGEFKGKDGSQKGKEGGIVGV